MIQGIEQGGRSSLGQEEKHKRGTKIRLQIDPTTTANV
jgi:hypothetical protein